MQTPAMPNEVTLVAERGGSVPCAPTTSAAERAQLYTIAWGLLRILGDAGS